MWADLSSIQTPFDVTAGSRYRVTNVHSVSHRTNTAVIQLAKLSQPSGRKSSSIIIPVFDCNNAKDGVSLTIHDLYSVLLEQNHHPTIVLSDDGTIRLD